MNKIKIHLTLVFISLSIGLLAQKPIHFDRKAQLVNPFVGTDAHGHTYPGAIAPFGMVQLSPDTRLEGWDGCSGYHYSDTIIYGFSHTHLSGTGCSDYGDFLFMPTTKNKDSIYYEFFSHKDEKAWAGYYSVKFSSSPISVELTATSRGGYHRYNYLKEGIKKNILIDLKHRDQLLASSWEQIDDKTIVGMRTSKAWNEEQVIYFAASFSQPIKNIDYDSISKRLLVEFGTTSTKDTKIDIKVSLSSVNEEGALLNLKSEQAKSFDEAKELSEKLWEKELGKIDIEGGTLEQQRTFYTALYHSMLAPNLYADIDGKYRANDKKIRKNDNKYDRYSVFSLWDTYRTLHPLLTIIDQKRTKDFVNTALEIYKESGLLPVWELWGYETNCMIGFHGISMITDAYMKGIKIDDKITLSSCLHSANSNLRIKYLEKRGIYNPNLFGLDDFDKYGYISSEKEHESVSKTLEYAYNMWCIAQIAKSQGQPYVYEEYIQKAQYYKNLYNPQNKFIQPKENGRFIPNFDPKQIDQNYTEGNGWQYGFSVPQDIQGLIKLMGGDEVFVKQLDACFNSKEKTTGRNQADVTGLIGQYAHGNEPSHHMAYLYSYAGEAYKTQELIRKILSNLYSDKPDGLCGNEDCGQMSAWYIMSALGFYPVCPASNEYVIGSPLFDKATIRLENGKSFVINAPQSQNSPYIKSLRLNGKKYKSSFLNHFDIMNGGVLDVEMDSKPNKKFAKKDSERPHSEIKDYPITIVPFYEYDGTQTFTDTKQVYINSIGGNILMPTLDYRDKSLVHFGDDNYTRRDIKISETVKITAVNTSKDNIESKPVMVEFYKIPKGRSIKLISQYDPQYSAGGEEGLIDQRFGSTNWRLGAWQGYNGKDFIAILDLGTKQEVNSVGGNFIQSISPWIFFPKEVNYYISDDGQNFTLLENVQNPMSDRDETTQIYPFFTSKPFNARYIKIEAINIGTLPSWHISAGEKAWLFIDEIIIK